ncbi:hypothetical protein JGC83_24320 [Salmonella enterica subsp. enterica serovar Derby]|nr:hypothetical protein [Salmonella enterica subsp. enterica serovar Derby]
MRLTLLERALLVKLFYQHQSNAAALMHPFRTRHNLRKGTFAINALKAMIRKFEATGSLQFGPAEDGNRCRSRQLQVLRRRLSTHTGEHLWQ